MPLVDIGTHPGEALTAPTLAAAQNGMVLGATGLWQYPPGFLEVDDDGAAAITNNSAQTSLLAGGGSNLNLGFLADPTAGPRKGDTHHILANLKWLNNSGANQKLQLDIFYGGSSIWSFQTANLSASASFRIVQLDMWVTLRTIAAAGSGAVKVHGTLYLPSGADALDTDSPASLGSILYPDGASITPTAATNIAEAFDLKATMSTNTATSTVTPNLIQMRSYLKNY
jgi:hypothetical protein